MEYQGFVGASYLGPAKKANAQRSINLYPEVDESGTGKTKMQLVGTPGLTSAFCTLPTTPVRGFLAAGAPLSAAQRLFAVGGSKLYEITSGGSATELGDVGDDGTHTPAQIFANGLQLGIVSAGKFYLHNGVSISQPDYPSSSGVALVEDLGGGVGRLNWVSGDEFDGTMEGQTITFDGSPYTVTNFHSPTRIFVTPSPTDGAEEAWSISYDVEARTGAFLDGYFIVAKPNSKQANISSLNDGTSWDALDFAIKESYPDNIGAILVDHQDLWLWGESTSEVWNNTGAADFPLERNQTGAIQMGTAAPWSGVSLGNGVAWLGTNNQGKAVAYVAAGYIPKRISTHAVERIWAGYSTVADAIGWVQEWEGHLFWWITFPTGNATWVYDQLTGAWHERAWWNGSSLDRHRARCHTYCYGKHLVGDHTTGVIYEMSATAYTDNGTTIRRVRTAPHVSNENKWTFFSTFRLDAENSGAVNPSLDWSVDGGDTFGTARTTTSAGVGAFSNYEWRRLGRSRDRVFRVTITAAVKVVLVGAYLEIAA
jgi:hypothetical protein